MNRTQIQAAMRRNQPFTLHMADGKEYRVPPNATFVIVTDDPGHVWVLPLLTMTGLSYDSKVPRAKKS